ncbi:glucosylglycerol hydrolase [Salinispira pacifica]|uniref:Uncharacterized protein n=1 Tax=Salinispira pacifica TaxID=1307761 RepID=V5WKL9_9SPIO|nr:glucosylglycerol hydrolase [Salinispira pacifica]AHC16298.1 hypothetical protein L21SP2_2952 [Salinispira pacifica]
MKIANNQQNKFKDEFGESLQSAPEDFAAAQRISRQMGGRYLGSGQATFLFWTPELSEAEPRPDTLRLEILITEQEPDFSLASQSLVFQVEDFPVVREGEFCFAVLEDLTPGTREHLGPLYRLVYENNSGEKRYILDPLAASIPFGAAAPAELYDIEGMLAGRKDMEYFRSLFQSDDVKKEDDGVLRIGDPVNMLELHCATSNPEGSLAGLTRIYREISRKLSRGETLESWEMNYIEYDAIQLMPIEPAILYEGGPDFWSETARRQNELVVNLRKPDSLNWGYDTITLGSPAVNPVLLETRRPHEFLELIETLHNFHGSPIRMVLDVVYGHLDNQAMDLLNSRYFAGANMYGQNVSYSDPMVRGVILEMQRRKSDFGVDGVRVDGAQDFKNYDPESGQMIHDDDFLELMNRVEQRAGEWTYRPWMIFEDGRPWPRDDWELKSSYREITKKLPNVVQWGPLTFAHNTPFLFTFWAMKWWRIQEVFLYGDKWITGTSNHDTLRRGTQVDPESRINTYLGDNLPDIFRKAYDNPAVRLFDLFMPGIPMDFLQSNMHVPWSFIRNTDRRWAAKVMSEEAYFLDWVLTENLFSRDWVFSRLKARGFSSLQGLRRFVKSLNHCLQLADQEPGRAAELLNELDLQGPGRLDAEGLVFLARDWMEDVHEICRVSNYLQDTDRSASAYGYKLRSFLRSNRWLGAAPQKGDYADMLRPADGAVIIHGIRTSPDGGRKILFLANMEGEPKTIQPAALMAGREELTYGWKLTAATPDLQGSLNPPGSSFDITATIRLENAQGILLESD